VNANELMKSLFVNVTMDGRYFIALQSRKMRWGVWRRFFNPGP
jgi:hypothetical protein